MIGLEIHVVAELTCAACTAVSVSAVRPPPLVFPLPSDMTLHRLTELQSVLRPRWCRAVLQRLLLLCCLLLSGGCATQSYSCGSAAVWKTAPELAAITHPQIERGKPRPVIDGFGWVWGIPAKLILFDRRVENHAVSRETENAIAAYLQSNELDTVKVRLNQYRPGDDWKRLVANKSDTNFSMSARSAAPHKYGPAWPSALMRPRHPLQHLCALPPQGQQPAGAAARAAAGSGLRSRPVAPQCR